MDLFEKQPNTSGQLDGQVRRVAAVRGDDDDQHGLSKDRQYLAFFDCACVQSVTGT